MTKPSSPTPSPTGRLSISEPEVQHLPGTPQALAQRRRMQAALSQGHAPLVDLDFSAAEARATAAWVQTLQSDKA